MGTTGPKCCVVCGTEYQPRSWTPAMAPICSLRCKLVRREARRMTVDAPCSRCGTMTTLTGEARRTYERRGRAYCGAACRREAHVELSSRTMAETNRRHASSRMKARNPMHREEARETMAATLREIGHRPPIQGGNGREIPAPQVALARASGWEMQVIVPTKQPRGSGYPSHYKINIADRSRMVAVEVDGGSHKSLAIRELDEKKDALLESLGWIVVRVLNEDVDRDLPGCIERVLSCLPGVRRAA